ncbi:MAG: YqgE/AlgH family protein [Verrucomicrobia bacterium]|nr:YqgE/AlgH family protein [Verrucomicrobiota bacterium]
MPELIPSLRGFLLLDGGKLRGSSFHRTVVLICRHTPEGAFGLVLNRPSDNRVGEVIEAELPEMLQRQTLFGGGPVQPAALSYLHTRLGDASEPILSGLTVGHDLQELIEIGAAGVTAVAPVRVFAGYAGWGPGQLDDEMRRESWLTEPATLHLVFETAPEVLWGHILRRRGDWQSRLLAESPDDLSWN